MLLRQTTQSPFTCSNLTIELLEKGVDLTYLTLPYSVSIVNFKHAALKQPFIW